MVSGKDWQGVFPAATTQFKEDQSLDLEMTGQLLEGTVASGVQGLVMLGSLGENNGLSRDEKLDVIRTAKSAAGGKIPVVSGVSELNTEAACDYVKAARQAGADGFMVLPAMAYNSNPRETIAHYKAVAAAADSPIIIYNNPLAYMVDITPEMLEEMATVENFVAIKESSGDTRRFTDIINQVGDRYTLFAGVDPLILECTLLGAKGWIAGIGLAIPEENQYFWNLMMDGKWEEAREFYKWFLPLAHLDVGYNFVQKIKLCMQEAGFGKEWVRQPRMTLTGAERDAAMKVIQHGLNNRPTMSA